jgi:hypothetical protein
MIIDDRKDGEGKCTNSNGCSYEVMFRDIDRLLKVNVLLLMEEDMKEYSKMTDWMVKEKVFILMEEEMKEYSKMTDWMVKEKVFILMEVDMKGCRKIID